MVQKNRNIVTFMDENTQAHALKVIVFYVRGKPRGIYPSENKNSEGSPSLYIVQFDIRRISILRFAQLVRLCGLTQSEESGTH